MHDSLCATYALGQSVTGSSSLDIDQATVTVTATCETDNDDTAYYASVRCIVYDDLNNQVAEGSAVDHAGNGYAQEVVSFTGQPGTNYTVQGIHNAVPNMTDNTDRPQGQPIYYYDPYNYTSFQNQGDSSGFIGYPGYHEWYGPGPVQETRQTNIHVGNTTTSNATIPNITIKFSGNKSSGDNLMFSAGGSGICSESLGYLQCNSPGFFRYNYEGSAAVKKASNWTIAQSVVSGRSKGQYNSGGVFDFASDTGSDGPQSVYRQTTDGSPVFWLDSPALGSAYNGDPVFSMTSVDNFSVSVCSTINTNICGYTSYFTKLVVSSGALTSSSIGGYGSISTNF